MCRVLLAALLIAAAPVGAVETDRFYVDTRYGQLHVHRAQPEGRATQPPLVLFHMTPLSARMFETVLPLLAERRIVYALDTPGYGESDPPPEPVSIEDYAAAIGDFLDTLPPAVDLLGYHTGAMLATELATTRDEQIRRVVLIAVPLFDRERRERHDEKPTEFAEDGSHLLDMWRGTMSVRPDGQTLEQAARVVAEKQRAGLKAWWASQALFAYDLDSALGRIGQPTLILRPGDGLADHTARAAERVAGAELIDRPDWSYGLFDAHAGAVANDVLGFLDEPPSAPPSVGKTEPDPVSVFSRLAIVTSDLEASRRFYTYALGYEVVFEGDIGRPIVKTQLGLDPDQTVSFVVLSNDRVIGGVRRDGAMLGLLSIDKPAPPIMRRPSGHDLAAGEGMLAVRTTDIDTVFDRLRELNARILLEPLTSPDGRERELVVHDPDGLRIHVVERGD